MQRALLALLGASALLVRSGSAQSPVVKVVKLLTELEARIAGDGKGEQQSYDKTACWCEETLARKAKDITDAKAKIEELSTRILQLEGDVASHGAEIKQLKKDIAANLAAQKEATEVRGASNAEYENTKTESEQCIGALEAAINVLTPAGTGKAGFLATSASMREAQLIGVAASVRPVLSRLPELTSSALSDADMQAIRLFVEKPQEFVALQRQASGSMSALQVGNNPFGDYPPQSTQIQGILKGIYDGFTSSLEKANAGEGEAEKAFRELMATKQEELETLQATLQKQELDEATKSKEMAESKVLRDDTQEQLAADEVFFEDTKDSCKQLATDWATRSRLRTEELQGINTAIGILNSPEAQATFASASSTFVQLSEVRVHSNAAAAAGASLRSLAARHPTTQAAALLELASEAEAGGHSAFDKVIIAIDQMVADLRTEEQEDIAHRDRCQGDQNKNQNDMQDADHAIAKSGEALERMGNKQESLHGAVENLEQSISTTKGEMEEALKLRNKATADFKQALLDDTNGVELLSNAIVALSSFYKRNKIPLALAQRRGDPEYTVDKDEMPKTSWQDKGKTEGANYGGRQSDSQPIISMIAQIKSDLEHEIKTSKEEDAAAQGAYETQRGAMRDSVQADTATKVATEGELAELTSKAADEEEHKASRQADLANQKEMSQSLGTDCAWVKTHFESRRESRKTEISGLVEAKNYLAGSEDPLQ